MKIESQLLDDHQVKLKVEIEPEPLEAAKRRAAKEIARRTKIPGFRPGKAPYHIVERFAGPNAILANAIDLLVKDLYPKIIEEAGIKPYGPGKLEKIPSPDSPTFEFIVPLDAEVDLGDYHAIRIPYEPKGVTEEDVDQVLQNMREQQAVIEPVERPAQEGDLVTVKLNAERKQVEEGEVPTLIRERSIPVIIQPENAGEKAPSQSEWPFPGFSRNLIGLSVGDERTITYTFPEDSSFELLRAKEAEYHFIVESVKSRTLPDLNDEFAQSQGEYENLEALRTEVRNRLAEQMATQYEDEYNEKIIAELLQGSTVKYPPQMVEEEVHTLLHQLENRLAQQKMELETYLKTRQIDREALEKEYVPVAESRLKRYLALYEAARAEDIQVQPEEIQEETTQTIQQYSQSLSPEESRKGFSNNFVESLSRNIMADLLIRHTMQRLQAIAKGEQVQAAELGAEPAQAAVSGESQVEPAVEEIPAIPMAPGELQAESASQEIPAQPEGVASAGEPAAERTEPAELSEVVDEQQPTQEANE